MSFAALITLNYLIHLTGIYVVTKLSPLIELLTHYSSAIAVASLFCNIIFSTRLGTYENFYYYRYLSNTYGQKQIHL